MKFISIFKNFQMNTAPYEVREEVAGQIVMSKKTRLPIEFVNGRYETDDEERIEAIKAHPLFGSEIVIDPDVVPVPDENGNTPAEEVEASTMNQMIAFLVEVKTADPAEFKGKLKDDLIAYALEKYNVKFI